MIYQKPTAQIIEFDNSDVITASGGKEHCSSALVIVEVFVCLIKGSFKPHSYGFSEGEAGPENDPFANF